jgi:phosphoketolase
MLTTIDERLLAQMDTYRRASNYLSVGQIYPLDNPLLKEPLKREHVKPEQMIQRPASDLADDRSENAQRMDMPAGD